MRRPAIHWIGASGVSRPKSMDSEIILVSCAWFFKTCSWRPL